MIFIIMALFLHYLIPFIFFLPLSKQIPTLVLGPSGCGKTHMLVECVKLLMLFAPEMHILICTHTNAAANIFVERLHMECKGEQDTREIVENESLTEGGRLADSESIFTGSSLRSLSEMAKEKRGCTSPVAVLRVLRSCER